MEPAEALVCPKCGKPMRALWHSRYMRSSGLRGAFYAVHKPRRTCYLVSDDVASAARSLVVALALRRAIARFRFQLQYAGYWPSDPLRILLEEGARVCGMDRGLCEEVVGALEEVVVELRRVMGDERYRRCFCFDARVE